MESPTKDDRPILAWGSKVVIYRFAGDSRGYEYTTEYRRLMKTFSKFMRLGASVDYNETHEPDTQTRRYRRLASYRIYGPIDKSLKSPKRRKRS